MVHATNVVGYTFQADVWCGGCIAEVFSDGTYGDAEYVLDSYAPAGVDRSDERSFDSSEYPKVIFSSQANDEGWDHCHRCGECIGHDPRDCEDDD